METEELSQDTPVPMAPYENGGSPQYLSVAEIIERAPSDCEERDVEVWGGKVRVKGLTAAQSARVRQVSLNLKGRNPEMAWADMEREQFRLGVIEPKFTADQVKTLHLSAGAGFAAVIAVLDELSGTNKEELRTAQAEFPESEL